jgi:hypothetical protein
MNASTRQPNAEEIELFCRPRPINKEQSLVLVVDNKPQYPIKGKISEIVKSMEGRDFAGVARHYKEKGIVIKVKKKEDQDKEEANKKEETPSNCPSNDIVIESLKDDMNNYEIDGMDEDFGPLI